MFLASLERLIARDAATICFGHHGFFPNPSELLRKHKNQLTLWEKVITEAAGQESRDGLTGACLNRLLRRDPLMKHVRGAPAAVQGRERFFLANSIRGFIEDLHLRSGGDKENG